jgi:3-phosphoshikimate 1-carboxyvinyltransferase
VNGLRIGSHQSDAEVLNVLQDAGAAMKITGDAVEISKSDMKAFEFDATEAPDLFPPLVALAAYCKGTSTIRGASRLIHKESDRAAALISEFEKMGIRVEAVNDSLVVTGGQVTGARVNSHEDHRIAMAAAVAALGASGTVHIKDSHCVGKSYPLFFDDLRNIGAVIHE